VRLSLHQMLRAPEEVANTQLDVAWQAVVAHHEVERIKLLPPMNLRRVAIGEAARQDPNPAVRIYLGIVYRG